MMAPQNVVRQFLQSIPELALTVRRAANLDEPYGAFGEIGRWLIDEIHAGNEDGVLVKRTLAFFDEMAQSADREVLNILAAGAFESLSDDEAAVEVVRDRLTGRARGFLEKIVNGETWTDEDIR